MSNGISLVSILSTGLSTEEKERRKEQDTYYITPTRDSFLYYSNKS